MLHIVRFHDWDSLRPWLPAWNALARGMPFRGWDWNSTWWDIYGQSTPNTDFCVLGVFDSTGDAVAFAPWCIQPSRRFGRVLQWLGAGEVCGDYLDILARPDRANEVAATLADWLTDSGQAPSASPDPGWDVLEFTAVDAEDSVVGRLLNQLATRGHRIVRRPAQRSWRIALPSSWDEYLALLSKSHRKQMRRIERRYFDTGRAVLHTVQTSSDLAHGMDILINLHQRRHASLGRLGCFASSRFLRFHAALMPQLLAAGQLRLHWVELEGRPIAAEYQMRGERVVYAYQAGLEPQMLDAEPGRLAAIATLRLAMEEGIQTFDLLRGDEPYKAHYRAQPRQLCDARVVSHSAAARLRHGVWSAGENIKRWVKDRASAASLTVRNA